MTSPRKGICCPGKSGLAFDGSQNDLVLTLPDDISVKDLKWISIWDIQSERTVWDNTRGNSFSWFCLLIQKGIKPKSSGMYVH